ncbi:MAG: HAMP domain-containing protein [Candidatus Omnitrophota bacterium]|jgi:serine phosphatase RsbU (regulator of sigma subunit)|nr:MAG: HAMP domain-containing protein [Candidatus Omnitrophota bacterium]
MIRIKIPFQFKIYLLILFLFVLLLQQIASRVNTIVSNQFVQEETLRFEGLKTLFYNLLRLKIESLEKEARVLADQIYVREALETLADGRLVESFLVSAIPADQRREIVIVTDKNGTVVDGIFPLGKDEDANLSMPIDQIQQFLLSFPQLKDVLHNGLPTTAYIAFGSSDPPHIFVLSSTPVFNEERNQTIGSIILGFPVDEHLAQTLRRGSHYHIGFILGDRIISSTLEQERMIDLSNTWSNMSRSNRRSVLDKPQVIELFHESYLAYSAPLPVSHDSQGWYLILRSLEDTYLSLQRLRQSVLGNSLIILCLTLLIGYVLARGVTAPLKILAERVARISKGDFTFTPSLRTGDELELLNQAINQMAQTLQSRELEIKEYVCKIEDWNKELEEKVAERTKDLEEKNFRLRTISKELGRAYAQIDDELKVVAQLQKKLLPAPSKDFDHCLIRSYYLPNGRTGGDYYDYLSSDPRRLFVLMADVSGHGTPAAFIMGITRAMSHSMIPHMTSPVAILRSLNNVLLNTIRRGEFVTMFLGCLDFASNQLHYSVAGHPPPFLYRADHNNLEKLAVDRGLPLGIMEEAIYEEVIVQIQPGDRLLLYTDGIIEAHNEKKDFFSEERLEAIVRKNADLPPEDLLDAIMQALEDFVDRPLEIEPLEDDVTLMAIDFFNDEKPVFLSAIDK